MNKLRKYIISINYYILDRYAFIKSLFNINPISRIYDNWYYRRGKLLSKYELINNRIDDWHNSDTSLKLHEYLGDRKSVV